jgi:hypothetical protein
MHNIGSADRTLGNTGLDQCGSLKNFEERVRERGGGERERMPICIKGKQAFYKGQSNIFGVPKQKLVI